MSAVHEDFSDWFSSELDELERRCDQADWSGVELSEPETSDPGRAARCGANFATYVELSPSPGWEDRLCDLFCWELDEDTEQEAFHAAQQVWERRQGEETVGYSVDVVKQYAAGRWPEIMQTIGGLSADQVDGRHQPCPKCGGRDRFRALNDFEETGAMLCNQCFYGRNGDGFSALEWLNGKSFPDVLKDVGEFLGIPARPSSTTAAGEEAEQPTIDINAGEFWSLSEMMDEYQELRPEVVKGILRKGEVFNIIAAPKVGKTYLSMCLAVAVAGGDRWIGFDTAPGRVLIIDNELHRETLTDRMREVYWKLQRRPDNIDVITLRGKLCDIDALGERLNVFEKGRYSLVLLDALYRMLPKGTNESDNAAMTAIWNTLDSYATRLDAAIGVIHHASKGDQGGKDVTDVGSGAGSISRAADTHLIIRAHEQEGHAVLEARCRSFVSPKPVTIKFEYPVWYATTLAAEVKQRRPANEARREKEMAESDEITMELVASNPGISSSEIRGKTGWGESRARGSLFRLEKAGKIQGEMVTKKGKETYRYSVKHE